MTVAALLGLTVGLGLWLAATAIRPRPTPLGHVLAALHRPATPIPTGPRWTGRLLHGAAAVGIVVPSQALALAGSTPHRWARDKVLATAAGACVPAAAVAALTAVGLDPPAAVWLAAPVGAAVGFVWPDLRLAEQLKARRTGFAHALSAYLDLVNVILAGGGGIETALLAAADAGDGWAFARLRHALERARRLNRPLWTAFDDLGAELGVDELRDLASAIGLAGAHGARIRSSLAVKADTMRAHQIAATEAAAEATTERMNVPTAVLLLGFLLFIVFPAVTAITSVSDAPCPEGTLDCPTTPPVPAGPTLETLP
jgi:tight adherence protein C